MGNDDFKFGGGIANECLELQLRGLDGHAFGAYWKIAKSDASASPPVEKYELLYRFQK